MKFSRNITLILDLDLTIPFKRIDAGASILFNNFEHVDQLRSVAVEVIEVGGEAESPTAEQGQSLW